MGELRLTAPGRRLSEYEGEIRLDENGNPITEMDPTPDDIAYSEQLRERENDYIDANGDTVKGNSTVLAAIEAEQLQKVEESILAVPELERMYMLAQEVASLRAGQQTDQIKRMITDKEDKINELALAYQDKIDSKIAMDESLAADDGRESTRALLKRNADKARTDAMGQIDFILDATVGDVASAEQKPSDDGGVLRVNRGETKPQQEVPINPKLDELASGYDEARGVDSEPEKSPSEADKLRDELMKLVGELGNVMDKSSIQAMQLMRRIVKAKDAYDEAVTIENGKKPPEVDNEPDLGTLERLDKEITSKQAEYDALTDEEKAGDKGKALQADITKLQADKKTVEDLMVSKSGVKPPEVNDEPDAGTLERLDKEITSKQAEYDALTDEEKAGDKGKALQADITKLQADKKTVEDLMAASRPGGNTPLGEAMANAQAEQAAQQAAAEQAEKERRFRAELALITQEVDGTHGEALRVAMSRYAELKADSETEGRLGRTKREKRLKEAEAVLLEAKLQYELEVVKKKKEAGLYEGDEAQIDELSVNDMFDGIRSLDGRTREATNAVHERRKENRNLFQRQVLKVGKFFTDGGKIAKWVKGAGSGFAMGFGVAATGVGIPVTTAVGLGLGLGVRGAATVANLDQIRKDENTDAEGKATTVMSQSQFDQLIAGWKRNGANSPEQMARSLGNEIFEKSRNRGYEQADRARRDANRAMGRFTIGFAAGGAANWAYNALNPSNGVAEAGRGVAEGGSTSGGAEAAGSDGGSAGAGEASGGDGAGPSGPELPPGAENIHEGEGWFSQFADMGMTEDQVKAMFSDTDLMNKLVDSGAAYPDNSKIIGGYGINMPASGRLAPDVMQIIADARAAKGF